MQAYLLVSQIASQYKHPIILNYKSQLTNIRIALGLTDRKFRQTLNNAVRFKLAVIEGDNLRLHSKTADKRDFKQSKKNDYRSTSNPETFKNLVLLQSLYYNQVSRIRKKQCQHELIVQTSDVAGQLISYNSDTLNYRITASCRAVSKHLKLNSTSKAKEVLDRLNSTGQITIKKNIEPITQQKAFELMKNGCRKNVRFNTKEQQYYVVMASEIKLNYTLKRTEPSNWDKMTEHQQMDATSKGYTKEYINSL